MARTQVTADGRSYPTPEGNGPELEATRRAAPRRIDPPGCGCTDCMTGYSLPLGDAGDAQIRQLLKGNLQDATSTTFTVTKTRAFADGEMSAASTQVSADTVTRTWDW
jgi:hypothetical protein